MVTGEVQAIAVDETSQIRPTDELFLDSGSERR
jgi:hypothetical protein